jgi:hypothetical protein
LAHCLTGWWLGLGQRYDRDTCPSNAVVALSPRGRWAVTRDLRWLDRATGRATQLTGRPGSWPVDSVDFVDDEHALVVINDSRRRLEVLCSQRSGCSRIDARGA